MGNDSYEGRARRSGRGGNLRSTPNPFGVRGGEDLNATVLDVPGFAAAVDKVLLSGCAIVLGRTRSGSAISITLLDGDDKHSTYCSRQDELDEAFAVIERMFAQRLAAH